MKLIWTKSNLVLSIFIRWGLKTDCSHFAIVFESPAGGLMFESNLLGTHPKFFKTAKEHMTVVHQIYLPLSVDVENTVWDIIVDKYDSKSYNFRAFLYFCWRGILKRVFGKPFPLKSKWSTPGSDLCGQVYQALVDAGVCPDLGIDLSISSPHEIYIKYCEVMQIDQ